MRLWNICPRFMRLQFLDKNNELFGIPRLKADNPIERAFTIVNVPLSIDKLAEISEMSGVGFEVLIHTFSEMFYRTDQPKSMFRQQS